MLANDAIKNSLYTYIDFKEFEGLSTKAWGIVLNLLIKYRAWQQILYLYLLYISSKKKKKKKKNKQANKEKSIKKIFILIFNIKEEKKFQVIF